MNPELPEEQAEMITQEITAHRTDPHSGLEDESRLRVHAAIHVVVETQLKIDKPKETKQTLERLLASGLTRHEAIHAIGSAVSEVIFGCLSDRHPYDEETYVKQLQSLDPKAWKAMAET